MKKRKRPPKTEINKRSASMKSETDGPFIALAVLCELVLDEKDGVLSVIRIVDTLTINMSDSPPGLKPAVDITAVLSFKSGSYQGKRLLKIAPTDPTGVKLQPVQSFLAVFEGNERGANFIIKMLMPADKEGVYWFDILLDETFMTRMPLRIKHQQKPPEIAQS